MMGKTRRLVWLFLITFTALLACNFPGLSVPAGRPLSAEELRQTIEAPSLTPGTTGAPDPGVETAAPSDPGSTPTSPAAAEPPAGASPPPTATLPPPGEGYPYLIQPGDTVAGLAGRFSLEPQEIPLPPGANAQELLPAGQTIYLPWRLGAVTPDEPLLPDAELVYSPSALDFDIVLFVQQAGGYLGRYGEEIDGEIVNGALVVQRVAQELSVNPRLLLAFIEYRAGWVYGDLSDPRQQNYPLGFVVPGRTGLYQEVQIAATQLNVAYYGWRQGTFTSLKHQAAAGRQPVTARLNPVINPGTAAVQHLLAMFYEPAAWQDALYGASGFPALYRRMFGDPWARAAAAGPLFPPGLAQPRLELPFGRGERWSLTAGPHPSWNAGTPRGALDFAPITGEPACVVSRAWANAAAPGAIARSRNNVVALDLDGDGLENTGWVLLYYHLAGELASQGLTVEMDYPLGHPSCEGGRTTGTHVHVARKFNGEWLPADGPLPFVLGGWRAIADQRNYYGSLVNGEQVVVSNVNGASTSQITR